MGVMSSMVNFYWAGSVLEVVTSIEHILLPETDNTALLESAEDREWQQKKFHDQSPQKNVADQVGVEPATSWSLVRCASKWATEVGLKKKWKERKTGLQKKEWAIHLALSREKKQNLNVIPNDTLIFFLFLHEIMLSGSV